MDPQQVDPTPPSVEQQIRTLQRKMALSTFFKSIPVAYLLWYAQNRWSYGGFMPKFCLAAAVVILLSLGVIIWR
jgi:hypothetical protein